MRTGARIAPVGIHRTERGHELMAGEPIELAADASEDEIAARCNRALEALIRRAPEEWTWFHDRYGNGSR
jgi:lauroyl/myristoyl acyltransferase